MDLRIANARILDQGHQPRKMRIAANGGVIGIFAQAAMS
jgi:hypothetical protein